MMFVRDKIVAVRYYYSCLHWVVAPCYRLWWRFGCVVVRDVDDGRVRSVVTKLRWINHYRYVCVYIGI